MTTTKPNLAEFPTGRFLGDDTPAHRQAARDGIGLKFRIAKILTDAFGPEKFAETASGIGPADSAWFEARTGSHVIEIRVTPAI